MIAAADKDAIRQVSQDAWEPGTAQEAPPRAAPPRMTRTSLDHVLDGPRQELP
ncbi:MAG TPA: hypothetical protein VHZ03_28835 [Trebonia sp.]|jgi:hypothetical protein|nr:hypothetical protein [Trebonia sp.]